MQEETSLNTGAEVQRRRVDRLLAFSYYRWLINEVCVNIHVEQHYPRRAADYEGEVLRAAVIVMEQLIRNWDQQIRMPSVGSSTIKHEIHTGPFDENDQRRNTSTACEIYKHSPLSNLQFSTSSTSRATSIHKIPSRQDHSGLLSDPNKLKDISFENAVRRKAPVHESDKARSISYSSTEQKLARYPQ